MQVVILAGGLGTRLRCCVPELPKVLAPIGSQPFLDYLLANLRRQGKYEFLILAGYGANYLKQRYEQQADIQIISETKCLGTGGALLHAYPLLQEQFFLLNGDTFFDVDYSLLQAFASKRNSTVTLRFTRDVEPYGFIELDSQYRVCHFTEKAPLPSPIADGYINGGIYYFHKVSLHELHLRFGEQPCSLERDLLPLLISKHQLYGLPLGGYFLDIGTPENYHRAQLQLPTWIQKINKPALFIDKDGTLIQDTGYAHGGHPRLLTETLEFLKQYPLEKYHLIMITNQSGLAKNKFNLTKMQQGIEAIQVHYRRSGISFDHIAYCPYHQDSHLAEYRKKSLLRKPDPGMILESCERFKIDLKNSLMIGNDPKTDTIKLPYLKIKILKSYEEFHQ